MFFLHDVVFVIFVFDVSVAVDDDDDDDDDVGDATVWVVSFQTWIKRIIKKCIYFPINKKEKRKRRRIRKRNEKERKKKKW